MKCTACAKELTRKEALYTREREPYCPNPFDCKHPQHPNSVANILARGGALPLYTDEQIEIDALKDLDLTPEMRDRIQKVATKPQSIRLNRQDIAYYLLKLQETENMASISEAVRYCVNFAMENAPVEEPKEKTPEEKQFKEFIQHGVTPPVIEKSKGVKIVVPERDPISNPVPIGEDSEDEILSF